MATVIGKLWGQIKMAISRKPRYDPDMYLPNGLWTINDKRDIEDHHFYDKNLGAALVQFLLENGASDIYDFGCGKGDYVKLLDRVGFKAIGYDGNPNTSKIAGNLCSVAHLHEYLDLRPVSWVLSLEVGEHIPLRFEGNFINNLTRHAKEGIILSWAIPGQGGLGHVNCQPNIHVEHRMKVLGFKRDNNAELTLRKAAKLVWFKNTIMVFRREGNENY